MGDEIRGAWTTNRNSEINPGVPGLADLLWVRRKADSHWEFAATIRRTLNCLGGNLRSESLRLEDGKVFNLPKNMSHEEQEKWRNETRVNFMIDYLEATDHWEMKLRDVKFAEISDRNWETLSANQLQERFSTLEWKKATTNAEANQQSIGFSSLILTQGMKPPMTFAYKTSAGLGGILQFYAFNKTARSCNALIRYKQMQPSHTQANINGADVSGEKATALPSSKSSALVSRTFSLRFKLASDMAGSLRQILRGPYGGLTEAVRKQPRNHHPCATGRDDAGPDVYHGNGLAGQHRTPQ